MPAASAIYSSSSGSPPNVSHSLVLDINIRTTVRGTGQWPRPQPPSFAARRTGEETTIAYSELRMRRPTPKPLTFVVASNGVALAARR